MHQAVVCWRARLQGILARVDTYTEQCGALHVMHALSCGRTLACNTHL